MAEEMDFHRSPGALQKGVALRKRPPRRLRPLSSQCSRAWGILVGLGLLTRGACQAFWLGNANPRVAQQHGSAKASPSSVDLAMSDGDAGNVNPRVAQQQPGTARATPSVDLTMRDNNAAEEDDALSIITPGLGLASLASLRELRLQIPARVRKARSALETALDDLGLDLTTVSRAIERFRRQEEAARNEPGAADRARNKELQAQEDARVLPETDISAPERRIWVVTTASLPWMTGTSINPLLRAVYLARSRPDGRVSLLLPWLEPNDQAKVFPAGKRFATSVEQETVVRQWLLDAGMAAEAAKLRLVWYDGRYLPQMGSIFPMGDITRLIPDEEADVCIMEEPEHLNWYRATGENWTKKFKHVVGIIHTNYAYYTSMDRTVIGGSLKEPWVRGFNKLMARAYCHKIVKLSATLQDFAREKETVCNVHGVRERFLEVGDATSAVAAAAAAGAAGSFSPFDRGAYFVGKMLWEKGYDRLWELMVDFRDRLGDSFPVDLYGSGPEEREILARAVNYSLPVTHHGAKDHATLSEYRVFVNPSVSEVLCTTVAEALAMGKWAVVARHPSNEFFYQFPNCLPFSDEEEFALAMLHALTNDPAPLLPSLRHALSWEAATERLIAASKVTVREARQRRVDLDEMAWAFHYHLGGGGRRGDMLRKVLQGGVISEQNAFTKEKFGSPSQATVTLGMGSGFPRSWKYGGNGSGSSSSSGSNGRSGSGSKN
ncbi:unnamed protein product, partial [Phaeothamnion confervicola]